MPKTCGGKMHVDFQDIVNMDPGHSICLFHNGNNRILKKYQNQFSDLKFSGNWAEAKEKPKHGCLWEICFADATRENLQSAADNGIFIFRHISDYQDDVDNRLNECEPYDYDFWLNFVVSQNLSFSNLVVSDVKINNTNIDDVTAIITTGRTANMHLQQILKSQDTNSFEYSKTIDLCLLNSNSAVFLWRCNQWECLTSTWIAQETEYTKSHQFAGKPTMLFSEPVSDISYEWINTDWYNMCCSVLDHAMFYQYVCQRPISWTTTEHIVNKYKTTQTKLNYNKSNLIGNYFDAEQHYKNSEVANTLNFLYNNVVNHINTSW